MTQHARSLGFIGLGSMGEPMALNLLKAGTPLLVWNRSNAKAQSLAEAGALVSASADEVFARCGTVFLMLADGGAIDATVGRNTPTFTENVRGRTLVNTSTVSADYSKTLEADVRAAGGHYVEAPVSGSRKPAEAGQLIGMLAGHSPDVASVRPLLNPMCRETFLCGEVPGALLMKFAVNLYLITMVTGLAEAVHFAVRHQLDIGKLAAILDAGPMASSVSRVKLEKLVAQDFRPQAAIANVFENSRLISQAARVAHVASPVLDACHALYGETLSLDLQGEDMIAVIRAIERRTSTLS